MFSYWVTLPVFTWNASSNYTKDGLENNKEAELLLIFENVIESGTSERIGKRFVVSVNDTEILALDSINFYRLGKSQTLPDAAKNFDNTVSLRKCYLQQIFLILDMHWKLT